MKFSIDLPSFCLVGYNNLYWNLLFTCHGFVWLIIMICIEIYSWLFHVLFSWLKYLVLKFTLYLWTFCFVDYNYLYRNLPLIYERFVSVGYNNLYYPLKFTFSLSSFFLVGYYSFSWNLLLTYLCFV